VHPTFGPWTRFLRAHSALTRQMSTRLETQHGLTLSDFDVLAQLYFAPERALRRVDLSRQVLLTASGITRLLDGLERAGWVAKRRCETDARVTYAVLTEQGVEKFEAAYESHAADVEELFGAQLSDEERRHLGELLEKLPQSDTACADD
jgi:DNA-binding MarR family transcriptional regulator